MNGNCERNGERKNWIRKLNEAKNVIEEWNGQQMNIYNFERPTVHRTPNIRTFQSLFIYYVWKMLASFILSFGHRNNIMKTKKQKKNCSQQNSKPKNMDLISNEQKVYCICRYENKRKNPFDMMKWIYNHELFDSQRRLHWLFAVPCATEGLNQIQQRSFAKQTE